MSVTQLLETAARFYNMGKHGEAAEIFRGLVQKQPDNAAAWHYLAVIEHQKGSLASALECIERAINAQPHQPKYYLLKGNVLQDQGRLDEAEASFLAALKIDPNCAQAYNNLGIVLRDQKKTDEAFEAFRHAIERDPKYFRAYNNLGSELQSIGRLEEAAEYYRNAINLKPDYVLAMHNLAAVSYLLGRYPDADLWFRNVLNLKPDHISSCLAYGRMLLEQYRLDDAELCLQKAVQLVPLDVGANSLLADVMALEGKTEQARAAYQRGIEIDPASLKSAIGAALTLPQVYRDAAQVDSAREHFKSGLNSLLNNLEKYGQLPAEKMLDEILWNNFNLAYQGRDDRELQNKYSTFIEALLTRAAPLYMSPPANHDVSGRRLRIGFLSSFFHICTAGMYFRSWITHLDKSRFETFIYYTNTSRDDLTEAVANAADHFKILNKPPLATADEVWADELDILVYPEIGMNGKTCVLSAMRLAPVQCAGWGHPVTTGHVNIDYYFSSALMEPNHAQNHYTEKLLLLPGIGTSYPKNNLPSPVLRSDFSLPEDKTLYLCPQSLFKIHPDNDELFLRVLEGDQNGVLVFFSGQHEAITNTYISRLSSLFEAHGMDKAGRVKILPKVDHENYLRVNMLCDVMLDTLYWSGGNTSLDALSCGLPIVTLPGEFMRGRQSYGMLMAMGIPELAARDENDYVRIALLLGKNPVYRKEISARIQNGSGQVFEDEAPVRALENYFIEMSSAMGTLVGT
jgi:protein O-GlcNAc transferase